MNPLILSVTQLNTYVKALLEADAVTANVFISGEISNLNRHYSSGHLYLSLKDDESLIKAVMFRRSAERLRFRPQNGMRVLCRGRVSLFERDGQYQLYIEDMQPDGTGALSVAFEQLKEKLRKEGLFDENLKRPIPKFPETVAVITSDTGAAIQDICNVITRRYPMCEILICPVQVQGDTAPGQIIEMIGAVNSHTLADVIILGRGGGSFEDLSAFNDEQLARSVLASKIPVISAVGHETDFTICDFVADLRAPTPSAAAELCVPDINELLERVNSLKNRMISSMRLKIDEGNSRLNELLAHQCLRVPDYSFLQKRQRLDYAVRDLQRSIRNTLDSSNLRYEYTVSVLESLSPLRVLSRGYTIAFQRDKPVQSIKKLQINELFKLRFQDGTATCKMIKLDDQMEDENG